MSRCICNVGVRIHRHKLRSLSRIHVLAQAERQSHIQLGVCRENLGGEVNSANKVLHRGADIHVFEVKACAGNYGINLTVLNRKSIQRDLDPCTKAGIIAREITTFAREAAILDSAYFNEEIRGIVAVEVLCRLLSRILGKELHCQAQSEGLGCGSQAAAVDQVVNVIAFFKVLSIRTLSRGHGIRTEIFHRGIGERGSQIIYIVGILTDRHKLRVLSRFHVLTQSERQGHIKIGVCRENLGREVNSANKVLYRGANVHIFKVKACAGDHGISLTLFNHKSIQRDQHPFLKAGIIARKVTPVSLEATILDSVHFDEEIRGIIGVIILLRLFSRVVGNELHRQAQSKRLVVFIQVATIIDVIPVFKVSAVCCLTLGNGIRAKIFHRGIGERGSSRIRPCGQGADRDHHQHSQHHRDKLQPDASTPLFVVHKKYLLRYILLRKKRFAARISASFSGRFYPTKCYSDTPLPL